MIEQYLIFFARRIFWKTKSQSTYLLTLIFLIIFSFTCGNVSAGSTTTTLALSPNPSTFGQSVSLTAATSNSGGSFDDTASQGKISLGAYHSCAIQVGGTIECWGKNSSGQLGDGTSNDTTTPVKVNGITSALMVAAGSGHSCALLSGGTIKCWGANTVGQLGNNTFTSSNTPVQVLGISTAISISASGVVSCVVLSDGRVQCWGQSNYGLGDGINNSSSIPVTVLGINNATSVSVGDAQSCAVLTDGTIQCWGQNSAGQLGYGTFDNSGTVMPQSSPTPAQVLGITTAVSVSAGNAHTCAVLSDGSVKCWGIFLQSGGGYNRTISPRTIANLTGAFSVAASQHTSVADCALLSDGTGQCWGDNFTGMLGNGTFTDSATPSSIAISGTPESIQMGAAHSCAVLIGGAVQCWGLNNYGQIGNGAGLVAPDGHLQKYATGQSVYDQFVGNIYFFEGNQSLGSLSVPNVANSINISNFSADTHILVARYSGSYPPSSSANVTLSVRPAGQNIAFTSTAPSATVGGTTYVPVATGGASGNAVSISVDAGSSSICAISSGVVSFLAAGNCVLDANQSGNNNYNAATQVQQSFTVGKGSQTITWSQTLQGTANDTIILTATATSGLAVSYLGTNGICSVSGSSLRLQAPGTCIVTASQAGNVNYLSATSIKKSFSVAPYVIVSSLSPNIGSISGLTSVIIYGTKFTGATAVNFGSTAATNFSVISDTQISATSPAGSAGVVDITVTTPNGTSITGASDQFTYAVLPIDGAAITLSRADQFIKASGFGGAGITIGVMSDDIANLATIQGRGELPAVTDYTTAAGSTQTIVSDEGLMMLEEVHAIAPQARLAFCSPANQTLYLACLDQFIAAGLTVIVDDIAWSLTASSDLMTANSSYAQAINSRLTANPKVNLITVTANSAQGFWQGAYTPSLLPATAYCPANGRIDRYAQFFGGNSLQKYGVYNTANSNLLIEWADTFGANASAFDIYLFNSSAVMLGCYPAGNYSYTNLITQLSTGLYYIGIATPDTALSGKFIKMYAGSSGGAVFATNTSGGITSPQALASGVYTIGAVNGTDGIGATLETFSNTGPVTFPLPTPTSQQAPIFVAPDRVYVDTQGTNFGSSTFIGTSAAAPNAAGVFALLASAYPNATSAQLATVLKQGATVLPASTTPPSGQFGYGRIDALGAWNAIPAPSITSLSPLSLVGYVTTLPASFSLGGFSSLTVTATSSNPSLIPSSIVSSGTAGVTLSSGCGTSTNSCTVAVTPIAGQTGSSTITLTVTDGAKRTATTSFQVNVAAPALSQSSTSIPFGNQPINASSNTQVVTLTNSGTAPLHVSSITVGGTNPTLFTQTNNCTTVAVSANCTINVSYKPTATGAHSALISIASDAYTSPNTITLSGTGVAAAAIISVAPSSLTFGNQVTATTSAAQTFVISNKGSTVMTVSAITIGGTNPTSFAKSGTCTSVAVGASCTISITFTPTAAGALSGTVTITTNAYNGSATVNLAGVGVVTSLAQFVGNVDGPGSVDGTGSAARFNYPSAVAIDTAGNLYVADSNNSTIRKITTAGVVTTLAGKAFYTGATDGKGAAAQFSYPYGVATDNAPSANVFVADTFNHTIRKVTSAGVVTTFAGAAGTVGSTNGTTTAVRFNYPYGLATDTSNNIYIADSGNSLVRKSTSAGVVTTFAGTVGSAGNVDGTGTTAKFNRPVGIGRDAANSLYVEDVNAQTIRKITSATVVTTLAGSNGAKGSANGSGASATFNIPTGSATDTSGNVYVADSMNNIVRKITPVGAVTTFAGTSGVVGSANLTGAAASFYRPTGIASDSSNNLYVTDALANTVRKITSGGAVATYAGYPSVIGSTDATGSAASFFTPSSLASDTSGNLYVADAGNHTIRKITPAGAVTTIAGTAGQKGTTDATGAAARFNAPNGVTVDAAGNVYVADTGNHTIRKITPAGVVATIAGAAGTAGVTNATGIAARFNSPNGVAVDASGNLYVADTYNYGVRKIVLSTGVVTTLAGTLGTAGSTNGTGTAAKFGYLYGIAVDTAGNVYVPDYSYNTIRKITAAGVATTLAGTSGTRGSANGTGTAATFSTPIALTVDASNNVYVADYGNCDLRKVTSAGVVTTPIGVAGQCQFVTGNAPAKTNAPVGMTKIGSTLFYTAGNGVAEVFNAP